MGRLSLELEVSGHHHKAVPRCRAPQLQLQMDILDDEKAERSWSWGDSTYRRDGFSIGKDYLRLEGKTIVRGSLKPEQIVSLDKILGIGAFSTVRLAFPAN